MNSEYFSLNDFCSGPLNTSYQNDYTKGYDVYLHEKDQFWPGLEMDQIGQTKVVISTRTELWGSFTAMQKISLDKETDPCTNEPGYSYTNCMKNHVATRAGCNLDLVDNDGKDRKGDPREPKVHCYQYFINLD